MAPSYHPVRMLLEKSFMRAERRGKEHLRVVARKWCRDPGFYLPDITIGFFSVKPSVSQAFSMLLPPPNVTGIVLVSAGP